LGEVETCTGSTKVDGGHDAVVMVAIDTVLRSRHRTKAVAPGHCGVFANGGAALIAPQSNQGEVVCWKCGIFGHHVSPSNGRTKRLAGLAYGGGALSNDKNA